MPAITLCGGFPSAATSVLANMEFDKYEALGNDYLVTLDPMWIHVRPRDRALVCDRRRGCGADGILVPWSHAGQWSVRIYNSDGTEAEKSGNGVRIAARFLVDRGCLAGPRVALGTPGGRVECELLNDHPAGECCLVRGCLGHARFTSEPAFVQGPPRVITDGEIQVAGKRLTVTILSLGNPHCVVWGESWSRADVERWGPLLESHELFPQRTNVQFARVVDRQHLDLQIWERGSGFTHASGSSSAAATCAAVRLGRTDRHVACHMPGGTLQVVVEDDYRATIIGPVRRIGSFRLADGFLHSAEDL